ncbi:hypothetical protein [Streptococcus equinus]|uniref:hypothetical protein n=1 Tax=Streptococcus equinus TaxID=1335 RepID=UPI000413CBBE|nr:hypothetical protein [Streptococcus equinus]
MNKNFIVHNGKAISGYSTDGNNYFLVSNSKESLKEGYKAIKEEIIVHQNYNTGEIEKGYLVTYKKLIPKNEIEKKYRITDTALINGKKYGIFQSSDDNFDQPDSWITIVTDDVEFLKANNIWEGAEVVDNQYGHRFYHSSRIPVSEVTILRTREDLPID